MSLPPDAEQLKSEGNVLFGKANFELAIEKYTAAIEIISDNAIFYANRSACHIGLKRSVSNLLLLHDGASKDATIIADMTRPAKMLKRYPVLFFVYEIFLSLTAYFVFQATDLDPSYAKGWGRLGASLEVVSFIRQIQETAHWRIL